MPVKLTKRQQQVLDVIKDKIASNGYPPTRVEIAKKLGFKSANAAEDHLKALARKGVIELIAGTSRGIRLCAPYSEQPDTESNPVLNLAVIGRVAAGSPVLAAEHIEKELRVEPHLFKEQPDYLLRVRGLSMRDAGILEGDLLAIKKGVTAYNGQIVVARLADEVTVKKLEILPEGRGVILHADNPDFEPIHVDASSQFEIEGVAVGLIRDWGLSD